MARNFPALQAAYAAHRVATYPLTADKTPAVRAYDRIGAPYSAQLALKYPEATAAGFVAGPRNRITVIDIDSPDDRLVDEMQGRFGATPLQVRTPSGGRHLYYRHGGELRRIRLLPSVDLLGAGNVVAAGSTVPKGHYEIERGALDDLDRLPPLRVAPAAQAMKEAVPAGRRNVTLFQHCQRSASHCDSLDQLIDVARTWAEGRLEKGAQPVTDAEIVKTATSAWRYRGGRKRIVNHIVEAPVYSRLVANIEAMALFAYLSAENGPEAEFWIADGLAEARGWPRRFVPEARKALLDLGVIECVRPRRRGVPAVYRWVAPSDD